MGTTHKISPPSEPETRAGLLAWTARAVSSVTRHIRFPGRERCLILLLPPQRFGSGRWKEEAIGYVDGLRMWCDLSSYVEWSIYFKGSYELSIVNLLRRLLRPGNRVVDVGANVGAYTLVMAQRAGEKGMVAAFEPNPETYRRLQRNLELNALTGRVVTHQVALSAQPGNAVLHLPVPGFPNRGIASLVKYAEVQGPTIEVPVETLDRVLANWDSCDLIKIDTDGNDDQVLKGAFGLLERFRPNLIFEYSAVSWRDADQRGVELFQFLRKLDYQVYWINPYWGTLRPIKEPPFIDGNIAALRSGSSLQ